MSKSVILKASGLQNAAQYCFGQQQHTVEITTHSVEQAFLSSEALTIGAVSDDLLTVRVLKASPPHCFSPESHALI